MRHVTGFVLLAGLAVCVSTIASAQEEAAPACPQQIAPTGDLVPWSQAKNLSAATGPTQVAKAALPIGQAADIALSATPQVRYALAPEKAGNAASYGGLVRFTVAQTGTYRIALGGAAWIDVVARGKAVASTAHGHGPDCTGIRKIVDFPLKPGVYTLQISGSRDPQIRTLAVRLP